jgi:hypothetical protein
VGGGNDNLMIYTHLWERGSAWGWNLDHYNLNHPKINAAPKKRTKDSAGGHNCSAASDLRKIVQEVGEGATVLTNAAGQR